LLACPDRVTSTKTRIIAQRQQLVRVDRESRQEIDPATTERLLAQLEKALTLPSPKGRGEGLKTADAVILGDYAKGVVTQRLLDGARALCRQRGAWLSLDPKPSHHLDWSGVSLLTPNRKEAFELAGARDLTPAAPPTEDEGLLGVAEKLLKDLKPALLLITLGDQGMLLCQRAHRPFLIPTVAREVFDVSGAGDTVIASFTLAIVAGASPVEAAIFSNHAAGIVVGKLGTATVRPEELLENFRREQSPK
jgi:D-beta-D-heptose 7-phosphate kinase/D-beta-D-heptose 1-phosphate adenosyltransferase